MEFLLNILWLLLTLPAIWLWLRDPACVQSSRQLGSVRPIVLLGCVLVLLFPVVSATDDMHVMRPELEESNSSKRQVEASGGEKPYSSPTTLHARPPLSPLLVQSELSNLRTGRHHAFPAAGTSLPSASQRSRSAAVSIQLVQPAGPLLFGGILNS
jgi:hypothetical protein